MRPGLKLVSILCLLAITTLASGTETTGHVLKVLPHLLDQKGQHTISPSLYDRDAYQAKLRASPDLVTGTRFDIEWKARNTGGKTLKLRLELRSDVKDRLPAEKTLETDVKAGFFGKWTSLSLTGDDYKQFGAITAWRVTLWDGDRQIAEQKSFLW
jgi:hypothetical protein